MENTLNGKQIVILVGPDFEDREVFYPLYRLIEEGAKVTLAGLGEKTYKGKYGIPLDMDGNVEQFESHVWDAVIIPGGWAPDKIRMNSAALNIVRYAHKRGSVIAAICHGGWVLASAEILENRKVTSFKAIKDDMVHAGASWIDKSVVVDENLVTSRMPSDLPDFCREIIVLMSKVKSVL